MPPFIHPLAQSSPSIVWMGTVPDLFQEGPCLSLVGGQLCPLGSLTITTGVAERTWGLKLDRLGAEHSPDLEPWLTTAQARDYQTIDLGLTTSTTWTWD